jgi:integrase
MKMGTYCCTSFQVTGTHFRYKTEKIKHSVNLRLKTSRDSYATTLKRAGKSRDEIGEMMGHSTPEVTEHYLASLDMDKVWEINEGLF